MAKIILHFQSQQSAKRFVEKVKKLPYVSYATDYCRGHSKSDVMVCGELEGKEEEIKAMKLNRKSDE